MNALTRHDVRHGNPGRKNFHPNLARLRFRNFLLDQLKCIGSAVSVDNYSLVSHERLLSSAWSACAA
jgi:hypothetical protein